MSYKSLIYQYWSFGSSYSPVYKRTIDVCMANELIDNRHANFEEVLEQLKPFEERLREAVEEQKQIPFGDMEAGNYILLVAASLDLPFEEEILRYLINLGASTNFKAILEAGLTPQQMLVIEKIEALAEKIAWEKRNLGVKPAYIERD